MSAFKTTLDGFEQYHIPEPNTGCWLWLASVNNRGYGLLQCGGFKGYAHRFAYQHFCGDGSSIDGLHVCHRCDNPSCVNPEHLFLGTASDNMRDCVRKGRHASQSAKTDYARGTRAGLAKLDERTVRRIRAMQGVESQRKLAARFGVTKTTIREIHQGRTWAHV
jgi:DNA-binding transcriptional regulator YiaG